MTVITWIIIFLTLGFLRLIFHWWPHWVLYAMFERCPLNEAERVLIIVSFYLMTLLINMYTFLKLYHIFRIVIKACTSRIS